MAECSFCGREYSPGTGMTFFKRTGHALHFCSRKCNRSFEMKRVPKKFKWTAKG